MNAEMNSDLLPPLHNVDPPAMSVSVAAVMVRSQQIRQRSRRRRIGAGLVAAAAVAAVAFGATQFTRAQTHPRPAHNSMQRYGALFGTSSVGLNGEVGRGLGGSYVVSRQPTGALLIAAKDNGTVRSLHVRQTFDGGWLAEDGPNDVLAAVAPADAAAVFHFGAQGVKPPGGSNSPDQQASAVILADGSTAVVVQNLRSTGAETSVVGYRRSDGSYVGYGGGISGVRFGGTEVVVSPRTGQVWNGNSDTGPGIVNSVRVDSLPAAGRTMACAIGYAKTGSVPAPGCTAIVVPTSKVGTITALASGVRSQEIPIPGTSWKVIFGVRDAGATSGPLVAYR